MIKENPVYSKTISNSLACPVHNFQQNRIENSISPPLLKNQSSRINYSATKKPYTLPGPGANERNSLARPEKKARECAASGFACEGQWLCATCAA